MQGTRLYDAHQEDGRNPRRNQRRKHMVFVYGTLMRGGRLHPVLSDRLATFVGEAVTNGGLINLGAYPGFLDANVAGIESHTLNPLSGERLVLGEVYQVDNDTLRDLDRVEGEGSLYLRQRRPVAVFSSMSGTTCKPRMIT